MASNVGYQAQMLDKIDGTYAIEVDKNARWHQISTRKNGGSAGTLAIKVKPRGATSFENLTVNGSAVSMLLNDDVTFGPFAGCFDAFEFTAASFNGTDFDIFIAGW
jgi:hypothetical protein